MVDFPSTEEGRSVLRAVFELCAEAGARGFELCNLLTKRLKAHEPDIEIARVVDHNVKPGIGSEGGGHDCVANIFANLLHFGVTVSLKRDNVMKSLENFSNRL